MSTNVSSDQALQVLREGNSRFTRDEMLHPRQDTNRRGELLKSQNPFAVVLTCSDSRIDPTIIFDQGLGDLFVIRNAGNVASEAAIASIEYAVTHLGVRLVVVLAHENCGAMKATIAGESGGHIGAVSAHLEPSIKAVRNEIGELTEQAAIHHASVASEKIGAAFDELLDQASRDKVMIKPAFYRLQSGEVEFLWS